MVFFAGTMFTGLAAYLFKVYVARMIGAEALGIYALGMTIIGFVGVFSGLGLTQATVRFVPLYTATGKSDQLRGFLLRAMVLLLAVNLVMAVGVVTVGPWLGIVSYRSSHTLPAAEFT
jgi:O-antigen/teichoic acid export membrane protein